MNELYPRERILPPMMVSKAEVAAERADLAADASHLAAFEASFLDHWAPIYRFLTHLTGDPSEAEDLAMETFVRLYQRPPKTGEGSNLQGWLYRVASNLGLHSIRSAQRRQRYEFAAGKAALEDPPENQPAKIFDDQESHRFARQALSKMRPHKAQLLSLRYSGLSYAEIARAMNLSPASIGPLLLRAEREFAYIYRSISKEEP
jgi:RNA polymerase sigma factor (sigma-70 family)